MAAATICWVPARCSRPPAVKDYLAQHGLKGRIRYYGCPAEEGGSSKGFMVRAGVFDDVDIAICWHPAPFAGVNNPVSLACNEISFRFKGRAAHAGLLAASRPQRARCRRADECRGELSARAHAVDRAHPLRTSPIPAAMRRTSSRRRPRSAIWCARATLPELLALVERVKRVAEGAALMTGTTVYQCGAERRRQSRRQHARSNSSCMANCERLGPPAFDDADRKTAAHVPGDVHQRGHRGLLRAFRPQAPPRPRALRQHLPARQQRWHAPSAPPTSAR